MSVVLPLPSQQFADRRGRPQSALGAEARADRLRICFVAESVDTGIGRQFADAIAALAARGHDIHLLHCGSAESGTPPGLETSPNLHLEILAAPRAAGWRDISGLRKIRKYLRARGPFDAVHGLGAKGGAYARMLKLRDRATPVVYTPQDFVPRPQAAAPARLLRNAAGRLFAPLADRLICLSLAERELARRLGFRDERVTLAAPGASPILVPPRKMLRRRLGLSDRHVAVGFAGRMDPQKAPERLIAAAFRLLPEMPRLMLVMIGDGPKRERLEARLRRVGLAHRVRWLGDVDARQYMPAFDILALPSRYEGFAAVLIEALHAGLPIVATPVGGTHETIEDNVNGFVVPHDAPNEMAAAIHRLAINPSLRRIMGESSRQRSRHFSIPRMADAIEATYRSLRVAPPDEAADLDSGFETL
jgi:glycosyltransferase involved in cell wall biosynthesis